MDYRTTIERLKAPRLFPGNYDHHRGNILIHHGQQRGIILDALYRSRQTEAGRETYYFASRHGESPREIVNQLNASSIKLQHELESKQPITFEYDSESLTFRCSLQLFEKRLTRDEVDRKWLKWSKFKSLIKGVCAFRVSANKGGSKSPTVRNILGAKLLEGEQFKLRRYDPSAGSRKDYWRVAPTWRSYDEAPAMAFELLNLIATRQREKRRTPGLQFPWVYYIIDELDNTVGDRSLHSIEYEGEAITEAKLLMDAIAKAAKEGEHLGIGIIICTQTPNVRQLMKSESIDRAFFNNFAQIVVEANVFDYLSSGTDQTKSAKLASDYRAVFDWCDKENDGIDDEARKYRPALFVNKAKREIIELPPLGEYGFDKLDPATPYDFISFDSERYPGSRSLDQALVTVSIVSTRSAPPSLQKPSTGVSTAVDEWSASGGQNAEPASISKNGVALADERKCPVCGAVMLSAGIAKSGKHQGKRKLACRNPKHHPQMGPKSKYVAVESRREG